MKLYSIEKYISVIPDLTLKRFDQADWCGPVSWTKWEYSCYITNHLHRHLSRHMLLLFSVLTLVLLFDFQSLPR